MKYRLFVSILFTSILIFQSCDKSNSKIDKEFEQEFHDSIITSNAVLYEYMYDETSPTETYFVNSKIKYMKYQLNPEDGYNTARIYFNSQTDSIEKYVLRFVQYDGKSIFTGESDTIFVIYPNQEYMLTYTGNQQTSSSFRKSIFEHNINYIYSLKKRIEYEYNN